MDATCNYCRKPLPRTAKKFCSNACRGHLNWQLSKDVFETTGQWPNVKNATAIARNVKRYLKEVRGICCEICQTSTWCGKEVPLVIDHIDGDSENSSLANVRLVCGNCDMQLPTYKSKNYGKGRHNRRLRYKTGQSY